MFVEKKKVIEVEFTDREVAILREAQNILVHFAQLNPERYHLYTDQRTGECFTDEEIKNAVITLGNLAYKTDDFSSWLFEIE